MSQVQRFALRSPHTPFLAWEAQPPFFAGSDLPLWKLQIDAGGSKRSTCPLNMHQR